MPVITVNYKTSWSGGTALAKAREDSLVRELGSQLPKLLLDAMAGVWSEDVLDEIMVRFGHIPDGTINGPDIEVRVEFGRKWHEHHERATTYLGLAINEWVGEAVRELTQKRSAILRPSMDIEVVLVDWHGVSFNRDGSLKNEW